MNAEVKTAVIFLRACRPNVNGGLDLIDVQRAQCMALAERLNATVIREYVEYGGTAMLDKRPELKLMLDELRALRDIDYIIAVDVDRLARRLDDWAAIDLELTTSGAKLVTVSGGEALAIMKV
jgi:DNA invertase Pin-like site-specific DNA recombinase